MINSNERKLCLSGWLQEHGIGEYNIPLKLQKFLFFYEAFSNIAGDNYDFNYLKGYRRGPVFSQVWGDYTHERESFNIASADQFHKNPNLVDNDRAETAEFIVKTMSEKELSELTHHLHIWNAKEEAIMSGVKAVSLDEKDFGEEDRKLISALWGLYPKEVIKNSEVYSAGDYFFVFNKDDAKRLTEGHFDVLEMLTHEKLMNPVFVEIDDEGRLIVD